jgi:hypothetical protein
MMGKTIMSMRIGFAATALVLGWVNPADATSINRCRSINQPGFYQLTRNLTASESDCLVITVNFVTIDLGGFTIFGPGDFAGRGISGSNSISITVRNGAIVNFEYGIQLSGRSVIENVLLSGHDTPILTTGSSAIIGNTAFNNANPITTGPSSTVRNNRSQAVNAGFSIGRGSIVTENIGGSSVGAGFEIGNYSTVQGNTAIISHVGFNIGLGSTVIGNTAAQNFDDGMRVRSGSTIVNNTATDNDANGITIACPSNVIGNTALGNEGINLNLQGSGCNVIDNLAP